MNHFITSSLLLLLFLSLINCYFLSKYDELKTYEGFVEGRRGNPIITVPSQRNLPNKRSKPAPKVRPNRVPPKRGRTPKARRNSKTGRTPKVGKGTK